MSEVLDVSEWRAPDRDGGRSAEVEKFRRSLLALEADLASAMGVRDPYPHLFGCLLDALQAAKICAWYWSRADDSIEYLPAKGGDHFGRGAAGLGPDGSPRRGADFLSRVHNQDRTLLLRTLERARKGGPRL